MRKAADQLNFEAAIALRAKLFDFKQQLKKIVSFYLNMLSAGKARM